MTKAADTHSEQQWLRERAAVLQDRAPSHRASLWQKKTVLFRDSLNDAVSCQVFTVSVVCEWET